MDDPTWSNPGVLLDDLPDDFRARIKAELVPGERILWAARPFPRPARIGRGYLCAAGFAAGFWGICGVCLASFFGALGRDSAVAYEGGVAFLGLLSGIVGGLVVFGMIMSWVEGRDDRRRTARELYALTDRRAIIWRPRRDMDSSHDPDALEIHSICRGKVGHVHRIESADGSGMIKFSLAGDVRQSFWPELRFDGTLDVRRVEDLIRKTLIETAPGPEDA